MGKINIYIKVKLGNFFKIQNLQQKSKNFELNPWKALNGKSLGGKEDPLEKYMTRFEAAFVENCPGSKQNS